MREPVCGVCKAPATVRCVTSKVESNKAGKVLLRRYYCDFHESHAGDAQVELFTPPAPDPDQLRLWS